MSLDIDEVRSRLRSLAPDDTTLAHELLREFLAAYSQFSEQERREIAIRMQACRAAFSSAGPVLDDLARDVGLFPYIASLDDLSARDAIAFEYHRPLGLGPDIVLHSAQAAVYRRLLSGENVILSAPTSFGKSLIIDAMIATERFRRVLVIVPTLALVDETRRRLSRRFSTSFRVITHTDQDHGERSVLVTTQERIAGKESSVEADFMVVDEFYKLSPDREDERATLLNQVFYSIARRGVQFYLLGPSVEAVPVPQSGPFSYVFQREEFQTVVTEFHPIRPSDTRQPSERDRLNEAIDLAISLDGQTVIYCRSPASARKVALALASRGMVSDHQVTPLLQQAASWCATHYHPDWSFTRALRAGLGLHHGSIPRSLAQFVVRRFNDASIKILVCTSTLIEGVNTTAQNVIIYDDKIGRKRFDFFTFANISGRSGRMGRHFIGHVYYFSPPPEAQLPYVDLPALTQSDVASDELLLQIHPDDLTDQSRERLESLLDESILPRSLLREAVGVRPQPLIELAKRIRSAPRAHGFLRWHGFPDSDSLKSTIELMWETFGLRGRKGVRSARQLAFRLRQLSGSGSRSLLAAEMRNTSYVSGPDEAVENVLGFLRNWAGFRVPRLLRAMDLVQRHVFSALGLRPGDYTVYAELVENHFNPPTYRALEEYGLPSQLVRRLENSARLDSSLDDALRSLRSLDHPEQWLSAFELSLYREFLEGAAPAPPAEQEPIA